MRKVTFGVACSLDHYIARKDHAVDWLRWGEEVAALSSAYWKTIDTVVMGRKTYEVAVRLGTTSYPGKKTYVFSHTMQEAPNRNVEIVSEDASAFVQQLKQQAGEGICVMGGGELARSLFEAQVIDELSLNIHPVLLGSGIPLFLAMGQQVELELLEHKKLSTGCLFVTYVVKR